MANPSRGQIEMVVGDDSYIMQLSPNSIVCMKKKTGLGYKALLTQLNDMGDDPDFEIISVIIWALLQDHHTELTVEQASGLLPDGGIESLMDHVNRTFLAANPNSGGAGNANPRRPAAKKKT